MIVPHNMKHTEEKPQPPLRLVFVPRMHKQPNMTKKFNLCSRFASKQINDYTTTT
jgi:hypothetical protein